MRCFIHRQYRGLDAVEAVYIPCWVFGTSFEWWCWYCCCRGADTREQNKKRDLVVVLRDREDASYGQGRGHEVAQWATQIGVFVQMSSQSTNVFLENPMKSVGGTFAQEQCRKGGYAPFLDLRSRDAVRGPDVLASRAVPRADGLRATVLSLRGDADNEWRSSPDIVTRHKGVVFLDVSSGKRKLRLDAVTINQIQSAGKLAVWGDGRIRTKYHRAASSKSGWCSQSPPYRGRRGYRGEFQPKYRCKSRMNWQT